MIKAFIFSGGHHQYQNFIQENHLDRRKYPMLSEDNWRGVCDVDIIRIGTFYENKKLLDMLPHIEHALFMYRKAKEN